jgi:hypothetical protein
LERGDDEGFDGEVLKHQVYLEAKKIMEQSGICKLATHKQKSTVLHLWKQKVKWSSEGDTTVTQICCCPLSRFGCACHLRVTESVWGTSLEMCGTHDASSHVPEKDQSKILKL